MTSFTCQVVLVSSLLQLLPTQVARGQISCKLDSESSCEATCDDVVLTITNVLTYPYNFTPVLGMSVTFSPCTATKCECDTSSSPTAVCLSEKGNFCVTASTDVEWTLSSKSNPVQFTISYLCSEDGCANFVFAFEENKTIETPVVSFASEEYGYYLFNVVGKCIGQQSCGESPGDVAAAGAIGFGLVALFLLGCALYFAIGISVKYFVRGARGIEVIPNVNFWIGLPYLLKDGCLLVISPCRTSTGYDQL